MDTIIHTIILILTLTLIYKQTILTVTLIYSHTNTHIHVHTNTTIHYKSQEELIL